MTANVTNYQCPACTGPLRFSSDSGRLECDYCGKSFDVSDFQAAESVSRSSGWSESETEHIRVYGCPSCGAELMCDDTTAATSCPYCGNPSVVPGQLTGTLRPDYVIPFKVDKEGAKAALKRHYKGKKFLPKFFSSENRIDELKGVYVPFWLFDGGADAKVRYHGTRVRSFIQGNFRVTVTDHYQIYRAGNMDFTMVPADGSKKMPDALMDAIEPYDYSALTAFSPSYLPGYMADKYDVSADECGERAVGRMRASAAEAAASTVHGYVSLVPESSDISVGGVKAHYALFPVWLLNTKWKDKNFLFAMNGQTGKFIGDLPVDKGRLSLWFAGIAVPLMLLLGLLFFVI